MALDGKAIKEEILDKDLYDTNTLRVKGLLLSPIPYTILFDSVSTQKSDKFLLVIYKANISTRRAMKNCRIVGGKLKRA